MLGYRYWRIHTQKHEEIDFSKDMAVAIIIGALVSLSSLFFGNEVKYFVFYTGILIDIFWQVMLRKKLISRPIDRNHLVERIGLLAIIILGESVIAMVASLSTPSWDFHDLLAAMTGFFLIGAIWWIYFDSFPILEKAERLTTGNVLIFTHLLLCMGLLILANMIRHAILGDLDHQTFCLLAISGLVFFYLGKQIPYWYAFPPWRKAIISNTIICVGITVGSSFLPRIEYAMLGMTMGMLIYVYLTFKRILAVNVDAYLEKEA
jgi:low temperature requirement protein LtrA